MLFHKSTIGRPTSTAPHALNRIRGQPNNLEIPGELHQWLNAFSYELHTHTPARCKLCRKGGVVVSRAGGRCVPRGARSRPGEEWSPPRSSLHGPRQVVLCPGSSAHSNEKARLDPSTRRRATAVPPSGSEMWCSPFMTIPPRGGQTRGGRRGHPPPRSGGIHGDAVISKSGYSRGDRRRAEGRPRGAGLLDPEAIESSDGGGDCRGWGGRLVMRRRAGGTTRDSAGGRWVEGEAARRRLGVVLRRRPR